MQHCKRKSFEKIILETDSLTIKNILTRQWKILWEYAEKIEEIQKIITRKQVNIKHIFREANSLEDYLANLVIEQAGTIQAYNFYDLSSRGRKIINLD
ncbi:hypothetical protein MTR67_003411 [Solanum verrucosum]|uniref:RNase H type-1 domain-containing protein n=1 Tax=Solanum verrucosum TaxID=315347 RepID=A0AAF0T9B5_SOLVR|nr:hypothetical protein MTR67_003411 [Solanum verrucosum]